MLKPTKPASTVFDWQGHRGTRGLMPENTIPAFLAALTYPQVKTLEMDVVITADNQVVVSHDPWMAALICSHPDGRPVTEAEAPELRINQMTLAEVQRYDCGSRGHVNFPEQAAQAVTKPTLAAVIAAAEAEAVRLARPLPYYNIEIKSLPEWDEVYTPLPPRFAELVLAVIQAHGISDRTTVQSFDVRSLQAVHAQAPEQRVAYLIANRSSLAENLALLHFKPDIYSPYFLLVNPALVDSLHQQGVQIIPWTVNETAAMQNLLELGVDGIITDYPDRIPK
jgi:glycerophosphoryl diester phosphodiesterase